MLLNKFVSPGLPSFKTSRPFGSIRIIHVVIVGTMVILAGGKTFAKSDVDTSQWREQLIHILGTTQAGLSQPVGVVAEVVIGLGQRKDHHGIEVNFEPGQGNFSDRTQGAIMLAIDRTARAAHLNPDSWSIFLSFEAPGVTLYGDSLSAMVGLTVIALAKGDTVHFDRVLTGTVTNEGHIGVVSGIPFKIDAAHHQHLQRILIPDEADATDPDWRTPFLMQISPVASISEAYEALTDRPLVTDSSTHSRSSFQ
jgi:hypothetical protein